MPVDAPNQPAQMRGDAFFFPMVQDQAYQHFAQAKLLLRRRQQQHAAI